METGREVKLTRLADRKDEQVYCMCFATSYVILEPHPELCFQGQTGLFQLGLLPPG